MRGLAGARWRANFFGHQEIQDGGTEGLINVEQQTGRSLEEDLKLLSLVGILEPLSSEEMEDIFRRCPAVHFGPGRIVYAPTDRYEALFVLKRGRVRLYRKTPEGREFTLAVVEGGTVFGETALTFQRLRNAYAEVAVLRRADLERLILEKPEVGLRLVSLLAKRLSAYETRLEDLGLKEVAARLASLILLLVEKTRASGPRRDTRSPPATPTSSVP